MGFNVSAISRPMDITSSSRSNGIAREQYIQAPFSATRVSRAAPQLDDSLRATLLGTELNYCVGEVRCEARLGPCVINVFAVNSYLSTFPTTKLFMLHSLRSIGLWTSPSTC